MKTLKLVIVLCLGWVIGFFSHFPVTGPAVTPVPKYISDQLDELDKGFILSTSPLYISWDEKSGSIVELRKSGPPWLTTRSKRRLTYSSITGQLLPRRINPAENRLDKVKGKTAEELGAMVDPTGSDRETLDPAPEPPAPR